MSIEAHDKNVKRGGGGGSTKVNISVVALVSCHFWMKKCFALFSNDALSLSFQQGGPLLLLVFAAGFVLFLLLLLQSLMLLLLLLAVEMAARPLQGEHGRELAGNLEKWV